MEQRVKHTRNGATRKRKHTKHKDSKSIQQMTQGATPVSEYSPLVASMNHEEGNCPQIGKITVIL